MTAAGPVSRKEQPFAGQVGKDKHRHGFRSVQKTVSWAGEHGVALCSQCLEQGCSWLAVTMGKGRSKYFSKSYLERLALAHTPRNTRPAEIFQPNVRPREGK